MKIAKRILLIGSIFFILLSHIKFELSQAERIDESIVIQQETNLDLWENAVTIQEPSLEEIGFLNKDNFTTEIEASINQDVKLELDEVNEGITETVIALEETEEVVEDSLAVSPEKKDALKESESVEAATDEVIEREVIINLEVGGVELSEESKFNLLDERHEENSQSDMLNKVEEDKQSLPLKATPLIGLIDVGILKNTKLTATHSTISGGEEKITLKYEGQSLLNLGVLENTYVIFQLPTEVIESLNVQSVKASYDVPGLLLGRNKGEFSSGEITFSGNQVILNSKSILSLSLLAKYYFILEFTMDALPETEDGQYLFKAEATKQIVDLGVLAGNVATATLDAPLKPRILGFQFIPETLQFNTTEINTKPMLVQRVDANWSMEVKDTRGVNSSWRITAETMEPFTSINNPSHVLTDAMIYVDEQDHEHTLTAGPIEVFNGTTGVDTITSVNWSSNRGLLLRVDPTEVYAESYATTIIWTLVDAP